MEYSPASFEGGRIPALLTFLAKGADDVFTMHLQFNFTSVYHIGPLPFPAILLTLFYWVYIPYMAVSMLISFTPGGIAARTRDNLVRIIVFQFICLLPMLTFLSCDIGRIGLYWIMSSMLVWLMLEEKEASELLQRYGAGINRLSDRIFSKMVPGKAMLTLMMLAIGIVCFSRNPIGIINSSIGYRIWYITDAYIDAVRNFLL